MRRLAMFAILMALGAGLAVPASAHKKRFKTTVTASEENFLYEGEVISPKRACERRRELQVWADNPDGPDEMLNTFEADRDGTWSYSFVGKNYYFVATRVKKTPGDHKHICKGDRSPTV